MKCVHFTYIVILQYHTNANNLHFNLNIMDITWHGNSCFTIKGKRVEIVIDPYKGESKLSKAKADIVLLTRVDGQQEKLVDIEGEPKILDWPGEYEIKNVPIVGIQAWDKSRSNEEKGDKGNKIIIFHMEVDGVKICHLGNLGHKLMSDMTEDIGNVDVLMIPVGGENTIDHKKAHEIIEQIDPKVVIPMKYDDLKPFKEETGMTSTEKHEKYVIASPSDLPQENTEYVVMKESS